MVPGRCRSTVARCTQVSFSIRERASSQREAEQLVAPGDAQGSAQEILRRLLAPLDPDLVHHQAATEAEPFRQARDSVAGAEAAHHRRATQHQQHQHRHSDRWPQQLVAAAPEQPNPRRPPRVQRRRRLRRRALPGRGLYARHAAFLHHPGAELWEVDPMIGRLLRQQTGGRQAGLCVDLEQHEPAGPVLTFVEPEIGPAGAPAPERAMRRDGHVERSGIGVGVDRRRDLMPRAAIGVFALVIVERAGFGPDLGHRERPVAHDADGDLAAWNIFLNHRFGPEPPIAARSRPGGYPRPA